MDFAFSINPIYFPIFVSMVFYNPVHLPIFYPMKKFLVFSFIFLFTTQMLLAQENNQNTITLTGKVLKKTGSKDGKDFCASQFAEYFVLQYDTHTEIMLENQSDLNLNEFSKQQVTITGFKSTLSYKQLDNGENMQVGATLTCDFLVVQTIVRKK